MLGLSLTILLFMTICCHSSPLLLDLTCPICEPEFCPKTSSDCPGGTTTDRCGCCKVGLCLLQVGDRCLDVYLTPAISLTDLRRYGTCGETMRCRRRTDVDPRRDSKESTCTCLDNIPVCGSDHKTYLNPCSLHGVLMAHTGPCIQAPKIAVGPVSSFPFLDETLALDCEVHGVPVPIVKWEFKALDNTTKILPGDDTSIVVQSRGGPEASMLTSWVQIVSTRPQDSGTYTCIATNVHGQVKKAANVHVQFVL